MSLVACDFCLVGYQDVMGDSNNSKPGSRAGGTVPPATPAAAGQKPQAPASNSSAGRVVHDERGNAVWDWVKDTARIAIDSTSRLLKKLEVPELKIEDTQDNELSIESERDPGGGYDPYGSSSPNKGFGRREGSNAARNNTVSSRGGSNTKNAGGGYDPYGKGVTRKPGR